MRKLRALSATLLSMISIFLFIASAHSEIIKQSFSGIITSASNDNPFKVKPGDTFSWTISYEFSLVAEKGQSWLFANDEGAPIAITVEIGNRIFSGVEDIFYPDTPILAFSDGELFWLDLWIDDFSHINTANLIFDTWTNSDGFVVAKLNEGIITPLIEGDFNYPGSAPEKAVGQSTQLENEPLLSTTSVSTL